MKKSQLMQLVVEGKCQESFEYHFEGVVTYYAVTMMRKKAQSENWPVVEIPIEMVAPFLMEHRVWEMERVMSLPEESWKSDPALAVVTSEADGESHNFVDGVHRILRRQLEGLPTAIFWEARGGQILHPPPGWGIKPGHDWGDRLVDGQIIRG